MAAHGVRMIDIGLNASSSQFRKDLPAVLARAASVGVVGVLVTGVDVASSKKALALCTANKGCQEGVTLAFCAGVHPHDAKHFDSSVCLTR